MNVTRTIDAVELLWTLLSALGLVLALDELGNSLRDRRFVTRAAARPHKATERRRSDNREAELELALVNGDVAGARWILAIETCLLLTGIAAMTSTPTAGGRTAVAWLAIALLIAAAAGLPAWLYGRRRRRHALLDVGNGRQRP